jgi:hypothetical protein
MTGRPIVGMAFPGPGSRFEVKNRRGALARFLRIKRLKAGDALLQPLDATLSCVRWKALVQIELVWMAQVNGLLVDWRDMPCEVQEIAFTD